MTTKLRSTLGILSSAAAVAVFVAGVTGCSQQSASTSGGDSHAKAPEGKPMAAPDKMNAASTPSRQASAEPPKKTEAPAKMEAPSKMDGQYASAPPTKNPSPPPSRTESAPPPPEPAASSDDDKRHQAEDIIYATIRIKMEEAIVERAKLLKEGHDPADERVRQLEGTIMRARELLTENGEVVEDVTPPIVQGRPKQ